MTLKDFGSIRGVVFLLMAVAVIALTFINKVDPKDFIALAGMAFTAYFTRGRDQK